MSDIVNKFFAYLLTEKCVANNTFQAYRTDVEQLLRFLEQCKVALQDATSDNLKQYLHYLHAHNISARSAARKITAVKALFGYAHEHGDWKNVAEDIIFPSIQKKLPNYLTEEEIEQLLNAAQADTSPQGIRNKVMLFLLYVSGARITELVSMKISDLRLDTGFVGIAGKGGKERLVPMPQQMIALLKEYIQNTHAALTAKPGDIIETEYLFPVYYGKQARPITRQAFWSTLNKIWATTGNTKNISPHQLRHSLATHMLKKGVNLRALQMILGHEQIATVQIYTHVETSHLRKIYDKKHPRS